MADLVRFYLHGLPGSQAELDFALPGWTQQQDLLLLDRLKLSDDHDAALEAMAEQIARFESVHLIGFSLGAMSALKLAAKLPETVSKIDLIAPAAPLELATIWTTWRESPFLKLPKMVQGWVFCQPRKA
jgi:pimeloyl-ACP methyl ester carboxylesterase